MGMDPPLRQIPGGWPGDHSHWHVQRRARGEYQVVSRGGHPDAILIHSPPKRGRLHFDEGHGWEKPFKPCLHMSKQPERSERQTGLRHLDGPKPRPSPPRGLRKAPASAPSGSLTIEREMGQMGKVAGPDGLSAKYRIADELMPEDLMGRKIRVPSLAMRRNGIKCANPGDKGYATAEHALEYRDKPLERAPRLPLAKLDRSWSVSGSDPTRDKNGRPIIEHVQIYCQTPWRRLSMYVHINSKAREIMEQSGEAGDGFQVKFKGRRVDLDANIQDLGIGPRSTVQLVEIPKKPKEYISYETKRAAFLQRGEESDVACLNDWKPPEAETKEEPPPTKGKKK